MYKNQWVKFFLEKANIWIELNPITAQIRYEISEKRIQPNPKVDATGYIRSTINGIRISWHQIFCECFHGSKPSEDYKPDHINGNREDNRPQNLRWATSSLNARNRKRSRGTSKFIGVNWDKEHSAFRGTIQDAKRVLGKGKRVFCGYFKTDIEAARACDEKMKEIGIPKEFLNETIFDLDKEVPRTSPLEIQTKEIDKGGVWKKVGLKERFVEVSDRGVVRYINQNTGKLTYTYGSEIQEEEDWYYRVKFDDVHYYVHRLVGAAFLKLDLNDKSFIIDHIDNNTINNQLSNLRKTTRSKNSQNKKEPREAIRVNDLAKQYLEEFLKNQEDYENIW